MPLMYRLIIASLLLSTSMAQASTPIAVDVWAQQRAKADAMRKDAEALRHEAERIRNSEDVACQRQFFVNACLEKSRDRYLTRINSARVKEIEASSIERDAKTGEMIERDKQRAANPPHPLVPLVIPSARFGQATSPSSPASEPASVPSSGSKSFAPQPTARPVSRAQQITEEKKNQQDREHAAQKAQERAQKADEDRARYEARAKAAAKKKAKHSQSEPQATDSLPVSSPASSK
ncbi:MAG TPA: hypothetical protein VFW00_07240 [Rhodocyclaceae bacterium]|nr:hypothetical protein [Rhodocyclaceae bacterium]